MSLSLDIGPRGSTCGSAGTPEASMLKLLQDTRISMAVVPAQRDAPLAELYMRPLRVEENTVF